MMDRELAFVLKGDCLSLVVIGCSVSGWIGREFTKAHINVIKGELLRYLRMNSNKGMFQMYKEKHVVIDYTEIVVPRCQLFTQWLHC